MAGGWEGGGDEVEEVVREEDVAAAGALVVGFGHGAGEGGAGYVSLVAVVAFLVVVGGARRVGGRVWWVFGGWMALRHGLVADRSLL